MKNTLAVIIALLLLPASVRCNDANQGPPPGVYANTQEASPHLTRTLTIAGTNATECAEIHCPVGEPLYPIHGTISVTSNAVTIHFTNVVSAMYGSTGVLDVTRYYYKIEDRDVLMTQHAQSWYLDRQIIAVAGILIRLNDARDYSHPPSAKTLGMELLH